MNIYTQIESSKRRSAFFIFFFVLLVMALGFVISKVYNSPAIFYFAVVISVVQALVGYYSGDKIALSMTGAKEIKKSDNPKLWNDVENLCMTAGLPIPKVYIIQDQAPNAFATGRDPKHASLAVTTGLLERLDNTELQGVIAHELSHIGNYDIRLMTLVVVLVGVIAAISDIFIRFRIFGFGGRDNDNNSGGSGLWLVLAIVAAILAPLVATLIQLAVSRKREFLADSSGALLTRYPEGLASALQKISLYTKPMEKTSSSTAHLFISSPNGKKESSFVKLLSTHPPIEERIDILRKMS